MLRKNVKALKETCYSPRFWRELVLLLNARADLQENEMQSLVTWHLSKLEAQICLLFRVHYDAVEGEKV